MNTEDDWPKLRFSCSSWNFSIENRGLNFFFKYFVTTVENKIKNSLVWRAKLLFPMPNPSTTELFLRSPSLWWALAWRWGCFVSKLTSCPNSAPITPIRTTAVVCLRFNSEAEDGFRNENSGKSKTFQVNNLFLVDEVQVLTRRFFR